MNYNWQQALDLARDKSSIRRNEREWGWRILIENTRLAKKMDSMLRTNFFVLMATLPVCGVYFPWRMSRLSPVHFALEKQYGSF